MKNKFLITSFALLTHAFIFAQATFVGQATYESKTSVDAMTKNMPRPRGMNLTPEMEAQIKERMRKAFEKTYILNFDRTSSTYKEQEKLEAGAENQRGMRMMMSSVTGGGGTYFKDVKEKQYTVDKEFMGKEFLVVDTLTNYKWQMTGETKKIGDYTAYKATAIIKSDASDFRNFRPAADNKSNEADKNGDKKESEKEGAKTNFFGAIELPSEKTITAWYTPEIPVNQGPDSYWGLPGLILEAYDTSKRYSYVAIKIFKDDKNISLDVAKLPKLDFKTFTLQDFEFKDNIFSAPLSRDTKVILYDESRKGRELIYEWEMETPTK